MLNCSISKDNDIEIVYLEGELDVTTADELEKIIVDFVNEKMYKIILDMGGISYISSNGLKPLIKWLDATKEVSQKRKLAICNLREFPREIFRVTEFDKMFPIYTNIDIAIRDISSNE